MTWMLFFQSPWTFRVTISGKNCRRQRPGGEDVLEALDEEVRMWILTLFCFLNKIGNNRLLLRVKRVKRYWRLEEGRKCKERFPTRGSG